MRVVAWGSFALATAVCLAAAALWVGTRESGATPAAPSVTRLVGDVILDAPDAEPPPPGDVGSTLPAGSSTGLSTGPALDPALDPAGGSAPAGSPAGRPTAPVGAVTPE
jgi:hypothetical protein